MWSSRLKLQPRRPPSFKDQTSSDMGRLVGKPWTRISHRDCWYAVIDHIMPFKSSRKYLKAGVGYSSTKA